MGIVPQSSQDVVLIAQPTGPRGFPGPSAPTYDSIAVVRATNLTGVPTIFVAGYYGPGTLGGGFFTLVPNAGLDNGGTIVHDLNGSSYVRVNPTWNVVEWGILSNVVFRTTPLITGPGANQVTLPATPVGTRAPQVGDHICIAGIGSSRYPLATTIISIAGNVATLAANWVTPAPTWWARNDRAIISGGTGWNVNDTAIMTDGTTIGIRNTGFNGVVQGFVPILQGGPITSTPPTQVTVQSTASPGINLTVQLVYSVDGEFIYGTDDGPTLNAMIAAAVAAGQSIISLAPNAVLGTTVPIVVDEDEFQIVGQGDLGSSAIMPLVSGMQHVLFSTSRGGGGFTGFEVDAFKLATYAIEIDGAKSEKWERVAGHNAISRDWMIGTTQIASGSEFNFCYAIENQTAFGNAALEVDYCFYVGIVNDLRVYDLKTQGGKSASVYSHGGGSRFLNCNCSGGGSVYITQYTFQIEASAVLDGNQCGNGRLASIYVNSNAVQVSNTLCQYNSSLVYDDTAGILLADSIGDCVITGTSSNETSADQVIVQLGSPDPTSVVFGNARASYQFPPVASSSGAVVYAQAATNALAQAALANGGAPMGQYLFNSYDAMLTAIGAARLALMDGLYFLATLDEGTALINIAGATSGIMLIKHGGLTFTQFRGYVGDGTSGYLDTQLQANLLTNYLLNNGSMAVWTGSPSLSADNSYSIGSSLGGRARINPRQANGNMATRAQDNTGTDVVASSADSIGSFAWSRNSSTLPGYTQYIDGAPVGHPLTAATTVVDGFITLLADGTGATPFYSARPIAAAMFGTGFSDADMLAIDQAVKNMLRAANNAPT